MAVDVSVLIPVYNGVRFLKEAVRSVLQERGPSIEVWVLDDGSSDGSLESVAGLAVKTWRSEKNQGIAATLNQGIRLSTGDFITILDSDDILLAGGIRRRWEYLSKQENEGAVASRPGDIIDEGGEPISSLTHLLTEGYQPPTRLSSQFFAEKGLFPCVLWLFLFRRTQLLEVGLLDESMKSAFDFDFILRWVRKQTIPILFEPVVNRRWHLGNVSHADQSSTRKLSPETIAELKVVGAKYGLMMGVDYPLWECGYQ